MGFTGTSPIAPVGYAPNLLGMYRSHWSQEGSLHLPQQTLHQPLWGAKAATQLSQKAIKAMATVPVMRVNYLGLHACWRRQSVQPHLPGGSFPGTSVHAGWHLISQNNFTLLLCFQALCTLSMAGFWKQCQGGMWARNRPSRITEIGVAAFPRELSHRNQQLPHTANVLILLLLFLKKDFKWGFLFPGRWHPSWVTQNSNSNTGPMSSLKTKLFV